MMGRYTPLARMEVRFRMLKDIYYEVQLQNEVCSHE